MNKNFKFLTKSVLIVLFFLGCSGTKENPKEPDFRCKQEGQLAPKWTCIPFIEGGIAALGTAQNNIAGDYGMQMEEAVANGRTALAKRVELKVKTLFTNWKNVTGGGTNQTYEKNIKTVSKQTANLTLKGSRLVESWKTNRGTLYVLVAMDNKPVTNALGRNIKTSLGNEQALWQQFQAQKAQGELDAELSKP